MSSTNIVRPEPTRVAFVPAAIFTASLMAASVVTYWLTTILLADVHSLSRADDLLGGMWAVIATIFVFRAEIPSSLTTARLRFASTCFSCSGERATS